jgi:spore maturation protein CgeB
MRAEWLRKLTPDWTWVWVDTDPPLLSTTRLWQSLAYRRQLGPGVTRINREVMTGLADARLDVAWVDKAIFLEPVTMRFLRSITGTLVHFTPDTAFGANSSHNFEANIGLFDLLVTTKSFEMHEYARRVSAGKIFLTTQGYDPTVHFPRGEDDERRMEVAFVGLCEPDRETAVSELIDNGVPVRLAGRGWSKFMKRWRRSPSLLFEGEDVFGDDYAALLSRSWVGLGLVSKRFPELHTTRTFEIPACGAVLLTERNAETSRFFTEDEAVFFDEVAGIIERVKWLLSLRVEDLSRIAHAGRERVTRDGRDYPRILSEVLEQIRGVRKEEQQPLRTN